MFRFLILGILFLFLCLGISYVSGYDSNIQIIAYDFKIELSLFTFIIVFCLVQFVLMVTFKILSIIFNIPGFFKESWNKHKMQNLNYNLMNSIGYFIIGNKEQSLKMAQKIYQDLSNESRDISEMIIAGAEENIAKKRECYAKLLSNKYFGGYAAKKIAQIYLDENQYLKAEKFALKAFDQNEQDQENILTLLKIYVALKEWDKFSLLARKFNYEQKQNCPKAALVANYFYEAARYFINNDKDDKAKLFLEQGLEIKPDHIDSLNLYAKIAVNSNNSAQIMKILKVAFSFNTCFEIGKIYAKCSSSSNEVIYSNLSSIVEVREHQETFLALASYLNLDDKAKELKGF